MGVLKTDVELTKDINIPGYEVNSNPNKEDINKLIYMIKEAKKPLILAGAGINHSKSNHLLTEFVTRHQIPTVTTLLGLEQYLIIPFILRYGRYAWILCK